MISNRARFDIQNYPKLLLGNKHKDTHEILTKPQSKSYPIVFWGVIPLGTRNEHPNRCERKTQCCTVSNHRISSAIWPHCDAGVAEAIEIWLG